MFINIFINKNGNNNFDFEILDSYSIYYGGMAAMTIPATEAESFLTGQEWNASTIHEAMDIVKKSFTPLSDARSGAEFRNIAAANLLLQFYNDTLIS